MVEGALGRRLLRYFRYKYFCLKFEYVWRILKQLILQLIPPGGSYFLTVAPFYFCLPLLTITHDKRIASNRMTYAYLLQNQAYVIFSWKAQRDSRSM